MKGKCKHKPVSLSVVCVHLLEVRSTKWIPIITDNQRDWFCPDCRKRWPNNNDPVHVLCAQCVSDIRWLFDPDYRVDEQELYERREVF
jgi:hypothetical protein